MTRSQSPHRLTLTERRQALATLAKALAGFFKAREATTGPIGGKTLPSATVAADAEKGRRMLLCYGIMCGTYRDVAGRDAKELLGTGPVEQTAVADLISDLLALATVLGWDREGLLAQAENYLMNACEDFSAYDKVK